MEKKSAHRVGYSASAWGNLQKTSYLFPDRLTAALAALRRGEKHIIPAQRPQPDLAPLVLSETAVLHQTLLASPVPGFRGEGEAPSLGPPEFRPDIPDPEVAQRPPGFEDQHHARNRPLGPWLIFLEGKSCLVGGLWVGVPRPDVDLGVHGFARSASSRSRSSTLIPSAGSTGSSPGCLGTITPMVPGTAWPPSSLRLRKLRW